MAINFGAKYDDNSHRLIFEGVKDNINDQKKAGINCYRNWFTKALMTITGHAVEIKLIGKSGREESYVVNKKSLEKFLERNKSNPGLKEFRQVALSELGRAQTVHKGIHQLLLDEPKVTLHQAQALSKELIRLGLLNKNKVNDLLNTMKELSKHGQENETLDEKSLKKFRKEILEPSLNQLSNGKISLTNPTTRDREILTALTKLLRKESIDEIIDISGFDELDEIDTGASDLIVDPTKHQTISLNDKEKEIKREAYNLLKTRLQTFDQDVHINLSGKIAKALIYDIAKEKGLQINQDILNKLSDSNINFCRSKNDLIKFLEKFFANSAAFKRVFPKEITETTTPKSTIPPVPSIDKLKKSNTPPNTKQPTKNQAPSMTFQEELNQVITARTEKTKAQAAPQQNLNEGQKEAIQALYTFVKTKQAETAVTSVAKKVDLKLQSTNPKGALRSIPEFRDYTKNTIIEKAKNDVQRAAFLKELQKIATKYGIELK